MSEKNLSSVWVAFITVCLVWGTTFLGIKIGLAYLPAFMLSGLRHVFAGTIFTAIFLSRGAKLPNWKNLGRLFVIGMLFVAGGNGLICSSEEYISSGLAAVMGALTPIYVTILSVFMLKNTRINGMILFGMAISLTGVLLISYPDIHDSYDNRFVIGLLMAVSANISWALGSVTVKRMNLDMNTYLGIGLQMLMGGFTSIGISLAFEKQTGFKPFDTQFVGAFLYLILIGSLIGYFCYFYLLKRMAPARVSTHTYANTVVAVLAGWALANEKVTVLTGFAILVVLAGVILVNREFGKLQAEAKAG